MSCDVAVPISDMRILATPGREFHGLAAQPPVRAPLRHAVGDAFLRNHRAQQRISEMPPPV